MITLAQGQFKAQRINEITNSSETVICEYEIRKLSQEWANLAGEIWIFITKGGVIGSESICLSGKYPIDPQKLGQPWVACAGGGGYPRLEVDGHDFDRVVRPFLSLKSEPDFDDEPTEDDSLPDWANYYSNQQDYYLAEYPELINPDLQNECF